LFTVSQVSFLVCIQFNELTVTSVLNQNEVRVSDLF